MSTNGISSRDAGSLKGSIFSSISEALDFEGAGPHGEHPIVKKSSASLVSFALKLSEGQLHCLYSALSHGVTIALKSKSLCLLFWLIVIAKSFTII